jgi:alpha-D-xyloside xylohydrolase
MDRLTNRSFLMRANRISFVLFALLLVFALAFAAGCGDDDDDNDAAPADDDASPGDDDDDVSPDDDDATPGDDDDDDDDDTSEYVVPPANNPKPEWPEWALQFWAWEDESTQESATALVDDYLANDFPLGAIIIDSPWETGYNTFDWNPDAFPDAQGMIDHIQDVDVRVMLWITANMNIDSPLYDEGFDNDYYVSEGRTYEWWKGYGSLIDYWNPEALAWWHGLMDNVLDMGIDGWKTDGSEFYVYLWLGVETADGHKSPQEYQHAYYRDFFEYTREVLGDDRLITARPVDSYGIPFWGPSFTPRDVSLAGWVGDQDPTWFGLSAAMTNMYFSGQRGYVNFGSDIGGYRSDDLRDPEVFVRWFQFGAMSPVMECGGGGDHRPWSYGNDVMEICLDYAKLHESLIPYLYSEGAHHYDEGLSLYRPLVKFNWHHMLGDNLLVAPVHTAGGTKQVEFPAGEWIDFFTGQVYQGPSSQSLTFALDRYPIFVRAGAILPLDLHEGGIFDGAIDALPPLTVSIYPGGTGDDFDIYAEHGTGAHLAYTADASGMDISLSATERRYAFRLHGVAKPTTVAAQPFGALTEVADLDALADAASGWTYLLDLQECWIKPGLADAGLIINVQ